MRLHAQISWTVLSFPAVGPLTSCAAIRKSCNLCATCIHVVRLWQLSVMVVGFPFQRALYRDGRQLVQRVLKMISQTLEASGLMRRRFVRAIWSGDASLRIFLPSVGS